MKTENIFQKKNNFQVGIAALVVGLGIALTLLSHWEPGGESWGYWLFARIFAETGRFVIIERGSIYALYLNLFRWLEYPLSVIAEYIVTSLIVATSLIILFKRYMGWVWSAFGVFLWMRFFQFAEPHVQNLALACSCLAILARNAKVTRFRTAVSYALFGLAYMFRSTYILFIITFIAWDLFNIFKKNRNSLRGFFITIRPRASDWPILFVLILLVWFNTMQSNHPWNNSWFVSTTWFPSKGKTLSDGAFIQNYNWKYIEYKYGTFKDKDFYFTNKELFNGADNMLGAIRANPKFVAMQTLRNTKAGIGIAVNLTMLPRIYKKFSHLRFRHFYYTIVLLLVVPSMLSIFYGAFRITNDKPMFLFLIANIIAAASPIISLPKERYMQSLIPIFILGAFWCSRQIRNVLEERQLSSKIYKRFFRFYSPLIILTFLIFFSNGMPIISWETVAKDIVRDISKGEIRIMERRPYSQKASFKLIEPLLTNCNGVLALEAKFIGAFSHLPLCKIYDIYEIPPFGNLDNSSYQGLHPSRIDCVLVSPDLETEIGFATNLQIRYQNYIRPYVEGLINRGAKVYDIKEFGKAVILTQIKQSNR